MTPLPLLNNMKELWTRLWMPQNTFWNRMMLFWALVLAGAVLVGDIANDLLLVSDQIPESVVHIAKHVKWVAIVAGGLSKMTRPDPKPAADGDQDPQ